MNPPGIDVRQWCAKALGALLSLWDEKEEHAWRTSEDIGIGSSGGQYFPTATFNAITAMSECGIFNGAQITQKGLHLEDFDIPHAKHLPSPSKILGALIANQGNTCSDGSWVDSVLLQSTHRAPTGEPIMRQSLVIGGLAEALRVLVASIRETEPLAIRSHHAALKLGVTNIGHRIIALLSETADEVPLTEPKLSAKPSSIATVVDASGYRDRRPGNYGCRGGHRFA